MSSLNFQYLKKYKLLTIFLLVIIFIHLVTPMKMVEGLSNKIQNQVLVGVGVDYQLYTYMGNTWDPIKIPKGLAKNPILLAITLGADGNLYAAGNDFHLYKSSKGGWVKPKQPSATEVIGIASTLIHDQRSRAAKVPLLHCFGPIFFQLFCRFSYFFRYS